MAFTIGSGTFTNGSATVTGVTLTSGTLAYFASGTRMVVGVNPVIQEVEAIAAPTVSTITLRSAWTGTGGTYSFLANQTSEGLRDAVQAIRTNNASLQSFIDSIDTAATTNSVAQRTSDGSINAVNVYASGNVGVGTSSPSQKLTLSGDTTEAIAARIENKATSGGALASLELSAQNNAAVWRVESDGISGNLFFSDYTGSPIGRMAIDGAGNVGIGTGNPFTKLDVHNGAIRKVNSNGVMVLANGNTAGGVKIGAYNATSNADGYLAFEGYTKEYMRIDSSGNVGIGTTLIGAPLSFADVNGLKIQLNANAANYYGISKLAASGGGDGDLTFVSGNTSAGNFTFESAGTERMRIDSSGNVRINYTGNIDTTNPERFGITYTHPQTGMAMSNGSAETTYAILFINPNGNVGSIVTGGSSTSYNTSSDYRLKEDWQPMDCACDRVMQLNPVNFAWKADGTRVDGFLAHELQEVIPEAVTGEKDETRIEEYEVEPAVYEDVVIPAEYDEDGNEISPERTEQKLVSEAVMGEREVPVYQGIDQSKVVPLLTAALQHALKDIADLKARIEALEG